MEGFHCIIQRLILNGQLTSSLCNKTTLQHHPLHTEFIYQYLLIFQLLYTNLSLISTFTVQSFEMKKETLKYIIQFGFYCMFIWFSMKSVKSFYEGSVIYEIYKDSANEKVYFPAITLCPNPKINPLMNLKLNQLAADKNIPSLILESYNVFNTLKNKSIVVSLSEIVHNYSYTEMESFNNNGYYTKNLLM